MIREVKFPFETHSENNIRGINPWILRDRKRRDSDKINAVLNASFTRVRLIVPSPDGDRPNRFTITFTRHSFGKLDSFDNVQGCFKDMTDIVALWMGFKNDANPQLDWQKPKQEHAARGVKAVTIRIEDLDAQEDEYREMGAIPVYTPTPRPKPKAKGVNAHGPQRAIEFTKAYAALPWDQKDEDETYTLTPMSQVAAILASPTAFSVIHPKSGREIRLYRHDEDDPALGGQVHLYLDFPPAVKPPPVVQIDRTVWRKGARR
jgi:hypothetical protein